MVVVTIYVFLSVVAAALSQRYGCNKNMDLIEHGIIGLFWPLAAVFFVILGIPLVIGLVGAWKKEPLALEDENDYGNQADESTQAAPGRRPGNQHGDKEKLRLQRS
jgi:hypothetical protein